MPAFDPSGVELLFWEALGLIVAACLFVPLFRRLGLGAVLGFLAAGIAVRVTLSASFADHSEELLHFAEFGVVLFLFVIGLELNPQRLWQMRGDIFGLGLGQVLASGAALAVPPLLLGLEWQAALVIGFGLSLSSTAIVMQTQQERHERGTVHGRKAFSILLLQDLAIVPLLLLAELLAPLRPEVSLSESLVRVGLGAAAIAALVLTGRYLLDGMFRLLAWARLQEVMTAGALGVVIAAALLMDFVGMSYAMGAFIAGVMLAESSYRHELEANIEPFRGLFLGLFFMAVGLSLDLGAVAENALVILLAVPLLMASKAAAIFAVALACGEKRDTAIRVALSLAQFGEFGFVLFAAASDSFLFGPVLTSTLVAIVTLSMALSPLVYRLQPLLLPAAQQPDADDLAEDFADAGDRVMVIGFGRFGQIVAQPLFAQGLDVTILDADAERVREARRFGFRVHYGEGARREVLRAAGAEEADLIAVCVDDTDKADRIVRTVQSEFPHAKLFVRSRDRGHSISLIRAGVDYEVRETFESALRMGERALVALGIDEDDAAITIEDVRLRDTERLQQQVGGDMRAGLDRLHVAAVRPEPLLRPEERDQAPEEEGGTEERD
ncbi:MAG: cation:proton antiporter [Acetobacterales bacterium]